MVDVMVSTGGRDEVGAPLETAVRATLDRHGVPEGEISLALLDDDGIRRLNREHLDHDYPTDVLSFSLWEEGESVVGDVYVGYDQALRQAAAEGIPVLEELLRLAIHGTLHVLGYDHPDGAEARTDSEMYRLQEELLREVLAD
jgi:probable rRNA maturation factor